MTFETGERGLRRLDVSSLPSASPREAVEHGRFAVWQGDVVEALHDERIHGLLLDLRANITGQ